MSLTPGFLLEVFCTAAVASAGWTLASHLVTNLLAIPKGKFGPSPKTP